MTDLVQRLRDGWIKPLHTPTEFAEAADLIERLTAERDMLVDALKIAKSYMSRTVPRGPLAADQGIRSINKAEAALAAVEKTK